MGSITLTNLFDGLIACMQVHNQWQLKASERKCMQSPGHSNILNKVLNLLILNFMDQHVTAAMVSLLHTKQLFCYRKGRTHV